MLFVLPLADTATATGVHIGPFLAERGLFDVELLAGQDEARHVLVRATPAGLTVACAFAGAIASPRFDEGIRMSVRKLGAAPLAFEVKYEDLRGIGHPIYIPPKVMRYTLGATGTCVGPRPVAPLQPNLQARLEKLLRAQGLTQADIVWAFPPVLFLAEALGKGGARTLVTVSPQAGVQVKTLGPVPPHRLPDGLQVKGFAPFLGTRDLFDLEIAFSDGQVRGEQHHLFRRRGAAATHVCTLENRSPEGRGAVAFVKRTDAPLSFDVQYFREPRRDVDPPRVARCRMPPSGPCACEDVLP
jgi:hypothetical protein